MISMFMGWSGKMGKCDGMSMVFTIKRKPNGIPRQLLILLPSINDFIYFSICPWVEGWSVLPTQTLRFQNDLKLIT